MHNSSSEHGSWIDHAVNKVGNYSIDIEGMKSLEGIDNEYGIISAEILNTNDFNLITKPQEVFNNLGTFKSLIIHIVNTVLSD